MATLDKIKVAVRVRPFNKRELSLGASQPQSIVEMRNNQTILQNPDEEEFTKSPKSFTFDHCFNSLDPESGDFASQADVFQSVGTDILDNAFRGYNACIFAYGQTGSGEIIWKHELPTCSNIKYAVRMGETSQSLLHYCTISSLPIHQNSDNFSGKSFSMMGSGEHPGIIPRLCVSLFERIGGGEAGGLEAKVEVSYMEIYNEKVFDLLDFTSNKSGLKVREHHLLGPYVDGLSKLAVTSFKVRRFTKY